MWSALIPIIAGIVLEGIEGWSEERKTRFKDKYHSILTMLERAKSATGENYTDSEIAYYEKKLIIFLKAYKDEVRNENLSDTN